MPVLAFRYLQTTFNNAENNSPYKEICPLLAGNISVIPIKERTVVVLVKVGLYAICQTATTYISDLWLQIHHGEEQKKKMSMFDAFELWCWRRLLRVPWTARRSNQSILKEINPEYSLEELMLKLTLQYFGHLMQSTD